MTNEPGYCKSFEISIRVITHTRLDKAGAWGMRIESALLVTRVKVCNSVEWRGEFISFALLL